MTIHQISIFLENRAGQLADITAILSENHVAVPDRPGGLNEVLQVISRAEIDVEYMYSVFGQKEGLAYMIFRVGDPERFNAVLASSGLAAVPGDELGTH